jgi:hypothetical protein
MDYKKCLINSMFKPLKWFSYLFYPLLDLLTKLDNLKSI